MKLYHRILGEGRPIVVLHGLFGYSDNWQTHAKKLSEYYQVILVDQRNHGHSPWSEEFTYDFLVDDLKVLVDDLKLEKIILLGHSMGGKTAMRYAQRYPNDLEKLIVVDIGVKRYPAHHDQILDGLRAVETKNLSSRSLAEEQMEPFIPSYGIRQFLLKNLYWKEKGKLEWRMNIPVLEREMGNVLVGLPDEEVFTPTLFIRGLSSDYILDEDITLLENRFPDMQLVSIENAGHWVHAEAPEEFIEAVLSFGLR